MKTLNHSRRAFTIAAAAAAVALPFSSRAQQNVGKIVLGFPPGGTLDFVARTIAPALSKELGEQYIVDNRAGANGVIGGDFVARAAPDMRTLFYSSVGAVAISPSLVAKMPFDAERDLTPISLVVRNVEVLVVSPNSPYNSASELVAAARKGAQLKFSSSGAGSVPHLAIELLNDVAKIDILHVPYKGGAPAVNDVMAGIVDGYFTDVPGVIGLLNGGRIKPIGITSAQRHPLFPQVKTFDEMGLPGVDADNWHGLFAPKGASPADVARVNAALKRVLATESIKKALEASGAEPAPSTPTELAALLTKDTAKWGRLIKAKHIRAD